MNKFKSHKKLVIIVIIVIVFVLVIALVFLGSKGASSKHFENKISAVCSDFSEIEREQVENYYLKDEYIHFYDKDLKCTNYLKDDYQPYSATVIFNNTSSKSFEQYWIPDFFSEEYIINEKFFDSKYSGIKVLPNTNSELNIIIWFNKKLSGSEIENCINKLEFSINLIGNFSYIKNNYIPKEIEVKCKGEM